MSFGLALVLRGGFFGKPLGKFGDYFLVIRVLGKVVEFIRVSPVIIKLFGAVFIGDQSPIS